MGKERRYFKVDSCALDLVIFQVVDHTERHPYCFAGGQEAGKLADVLADEIGFDHGLAVGDDRLPGLRRGVEGDVIEIVEHRQDTRTARGFPGPWP